MQFLSGSRIGAQSPGLPLLLRYRVVILLLTFAGVYAFWLGLHAAHVSTNSANSSLGSSSKPTISDEQSFSSDFPLMHLSNPSSITLQQSGVSTVDSNKPSTSSLTINNESILVPENSIVSRSITSNNGQTSIQIQASNQSSSISRRSSLRVQSASYSSQSITLQSMLKINNEEESQL